MPAFSMKIAPVGPYREPMARGLFQHPLLAVAIIGVGLDHASQIEFEDRSCRPGIDCDAGQLLPVQLLRRPAVTSWNPAAADSFSVREDGPVTVIDPEVPLSFDDDRPAGEQASHLPGSRLRSNRVADIEMWATEFQSQIGAPAGLHIPAYPGEQRFKDPEDRRGVPRAGWRTLSDHAPPRGRPLPVEVHGD